MKKQLSMMLFMCILIVLFLSGCQKPSQNNGITIFSKYTNQENTYSIEYPSTWINYEYPEQMPNVNVLFIPPSNETAKTSNFMISVINNISYTINEFKEEHMEDLNNQFSGFGIESEGYTTLSDLPGYKITFIFVKDNYNWRQLEVWTINENTLYLLAYQVNQEYYQNYIDDVEYMFESFNIID